MWTSYSYVEVVLGSLIFCGEKSILGYGLQEWEISLKKYSQNYVIYTCTLTLSHSHITHICKRTPSHIHTSHTHLHTHTFTLIHTHAHSHFHTYTHAHSHSHTYTHYTHLHTHTHSQVSEFYHSFRGVRQEAPVMLVGIKGQLITLY